MWLISSLLLLLVSELLFVVCIDNLVYGSTCFSIFESKSNIGSIPGIKLLTPPFFTLRGYIFSWDHSLAIFSLAHQAARTSYSQCLLLKDFFIKLEWDVMKVFHSMVIRMKIGICVSGFSLFCEFLILAALYNYWIIRVLIQYLLWLLLAPKDKDLLLSWGNRQSLVSL